MRCFRYAEGASYVYPLSSVDSHVSASPNHQIFRSTSLDTRAAVAYLGTFGYELDITKMSEEKLGVLKEQIVFMKQYRTLIQQGVFYRIRSPFEGNTASWQVVSQD